MPTADITAERFDRLANEACRYVFDFMISEKTEFVREARLIGGAARDKGLFSTLPEFSEGYFTIAVGYVGDAQGQVLLFLPQSFAEKFACKLLDVPDVEWLGEDTRETLVDVMGELGNSLVGLVKGGLTKHFPKLMLTTPNVVKNARIRVDESVLSFRKQYQFKVMDLPVVLDFCHE
ncbi:MAG: chemotaxis protein CheX [Verrucomicrobiota bacterium]